jgi:hypothetical protein
MGKMPSKLAAFGASPGPEPASGPRPVLTPAGCAGKRVLVCGGRDYADRATLFAVLDRVHRERGVALLVHGACPFGGADILADEWARARGVPVKDYPVDHSIDGPWPGAGPRRNGRMLAAARPDAVVAFPGDRGTRDMIRKARAAGLPVWQPVDGR